MTSHAGKKGMQILEQRLMLIKKGDTEEKESFIRDYMPFVVKSVSKCIERYLDSMESDEFSIGLQAFNEAIDRYEFEKGNFIAYANLVISSRIKDYLKKESRNNAIPFSFSGQEKGSCADKAASMEDFTLRFDIKCQMDSFKAKLREFGITLEQLVDESPKHIDTRKRAIKVALTVSLDDEMRKEFARKKKLPCKMIRVNMNVSQKTLRKSNKFIVAALLILTNDWPELKAQLPGLEEGGVCD